jgi:hypothetical protein
MLIKDRIAGVMNVGRARGGNDRFRHRFDR